MTGAVTSKSLLWADHVTKLYRLQKSFVEMPWSDTTAQKTMEVYYSIQPLLTFWAAKGINPKPYQRLWNRFCIQYNAKMNNKTDLDENKVHVELTHILGQLEVYACTPHSLNKINHSKSEEPFSPSDCIQPSL